LQPDPNLNHRPSSPDDGLFIYLYNHTMLQGHPIIRFTPAIWILTLAVSCRTAPDLGEAPALPTSMLPPVTTSSLWIPPLSATWQIQYSGELDLALDVDIYNLDLFDTEPLVIADLHRRGIRVMCYFSAGSYEDWRPDTDQFPDETLGNPLSGWAGETWLDIRRLDLLGPIMEARIGLARQKGCDGVDPDNVDGYLNDTGFSLSAQDQIAYNIFLAETAHAHGLSVGLKNDLYQVPDLLPYFDWALNEQCFLYEECDLLQPFIEAGKPVFNIEYELEPEEFCSQAIERQFNSLHKNLALDAYRVPCQ
jgi:hypothetical protein